MPDADVGSISYITRTSPGRVQGYLSFSRYFFARISMCAFALCPICTALTAVGEARPDLVEHVLVASREMLLAVRALIDARLEAAPEGPPRERVERLTIT